MKIWIGSIVLLACQFSARARAEPVKSSPYAADVEGQVGWIAGQHSGGVATGMTGRARYGVLGVGASWQTATTLLQTMGSASLLAGVSLPIGRLRLEAWGEAGWNAYTGVGSNFLADDPGAKALLPFAGGRSTASWRFFKNRRGVEIWAGPSFQYARDLLVVDRTYSFESTGTDWFSGEPYDRLETRTVAVGQTRYSFLATLSASVPL